MNSMHFKFDTQSTIPSNGTDKFAMRSELARDILKRANEFPNNVDAAHEYVANGYEAYDIGSFPFVAVNVTKDQVTITDHGCGMDLSSFIRFWTMHAQTIRRVNGLNRRGYNGTGKIAGLRFAERITVSTVHKGLKQSAYLSLSEVRQAAVEKRDPELVQVDANAPTAARNGTVITLTGPQKEQFPNGFDAEFIRGLHLKLSKERMMWMFGGSVTVNQVEVEPMAVPFDEKVTITSECGCFTVDLYYLERGYEQELQDVHIMIDGMFVAAEKFGKDGHRLANRVYARCNTTAEWSQTHFEHQRERFTSESRNLRLKTIVPAAQEYKSFVTKAVSGFLKELDLKEAERRKEFLDEQTKQLENRLSNLISGVSAYLQRLHRQGTGTPRGPYQKREIIERSERKNSRPRILCRLEEFGNDQERYRYNPETKEISVNTRFAHLKSLAATGKKTYASEQAILETVLSAYIDVETENRLNEKYADAGPRSVDEFVAAGREIRACLERTTYEVVKCQFEAFRKLSQSISDHDFDVAEIEISGE